MLPWPPGGRPNQGGRAVSARQAKSHADKVAHIMGTYGLPLDPEVLDRLRGDMRASSPTGLGRLAEEEAAVYLARRLHAMVMADLCSGVGTGAIEGAREAWTKFTQQVMYRADLGLVSMVLYDHEILPLIDEVERMLCDEPAPSYPSHSPSPPPPGP